MRKTRADYACAVAGDRERVVIGTDRGDLLVVENGDVRGTLSVDPEAPAAVRALVATPKAGHHCPASPTPQHSCVHACLHAMATSAPQPLRSLPSSHLKRCHITEEGIRHEHRVLPCMRCRLCGRQRRRRCEPLRSRGARGC